MFIPHYCAIICWLHKGQTHKTERVQTEPTLAINIANVAQNKKEEKQLETNGKRRKEDASTKRGKLKTAES